MQNIEQFRLTRHVTYSQYRAACGPGRVDIEQLLPPEFPNPPSYLHVLPEPSFPRHLFPRSSMDLRRDASFESREEAVAALCTDRILYWCDVCDKPLFFEVDCPFHEQDGDDVP